MNDNERYLFDLKGYLVVPGALSQEQVCRLNSVLDEHIAAECPPDMRTHRFVPLLDWGRDYRDLIDNPAVTPCVAELLGEQFRLDHVYLDVIRSGEGPIGTRLHGGAIPFNPTHYFRFEDGQMRNGLSVVAYNLKDVGPNDGGFGCVPGSHKSNYAFPEEWKEMDEPGPLVERVTGPAGTAIIFTEALTHGTLPWTGDDERRTIFLKYSPHPISWSAHYFDSDDYDGLTETQRGILEGPNARYSYRDQPKGTVT